MTKKLKPKLTQEESNMLSQYNEAFRIVGILIKKGIKSYVDEILIAKGLEPKKDYNVDSKTLEITEIKNEKINNATKKDKTKKKGR
jgi:hypothetical protein